MQRTRPGPIHLPLLLGALFACLTVEAPLAAQASDTIEVAEARALVDSGDYGLAADRLHTYLERYPDDVGVRWLLARTLYWDGEPASARRQLRRALERDPDYGPALALWREMRDLWAPRLRTEAGHLSDDQPLDRLEGGLEVTVPVSPWVALVAEGAGHRLDAGPLEGVRTGASDPDPVGAYEARAGLRAAVRGSPVRTTLLGGVHVRPSLDRSAFVGRGRLSLALGSGFEAALEGIRWSYEHTAIAADTLVAVESIEVEATRSDPTGFAGAAGGRLDGFPGGGRVAHVWAWLMAPVWSDGRSAFRLGYAFQHQDADTTTFRAVDPVPGDGGPAPPGGGPPGGTPGGPGSDASAGVYDPYYTPEQVRAHLALAALQAALSPAVTVSVDGGVGLAAEEQAPELAPDTAAVDLRFVPRDYTPWRIRGRLSAELSSSTTLHLEGGWRDEAFFRTATASAGLTHRFLGGLARP